MAESTHRVEIVPVKLEKHPNADSLSIVKLEGYQAVVRTSDWEHVEPCAYSYAAIPAVYPPPDCTCGHGVGAYIPPDSLVPVDREEFAFLKDPKKPDQKQVRVKARKLRGQWSMGLLIHAPVGAQLGDDVAALLGVEHYDPPEPVSTGGETEAPPKRIKVRKKCSSCCGLGVVEDPQHGHSLKCEPCNGKGYPNDAEDDVWTEVPKYDVEAFRKYGRHVFTPGEPLWVTEKIHGANGRWLFDGERFFCGSRTEWKRQSDSNLWWKALVAYPAMQNFLHMNPGVVLYGEVYGQVQDLKYGTKKGDIRVAIFDILYQGKWVDAQDMIKFQPNPEGPPAYTLPWVPNVGLVPFDFEKLLEMAEGPSLVAGADHMREGIVVKPLTERWDSRCGRVNLKIVSNSYLERA